MKWLHIHPKLNEETVIDFIALLNLWAPQAGMIAHPGTTHSTVVLRCYKSLGVSLLQGGHPLFKQWTESAAPLLQSFLPLLCHIALIAVALPGDRD